MDPVTLFVVAVFGTTIVARYKLYREQKVPAGTNLTFLDGVAFTKEDEAKLQEADLEHLVVVAAERYNREKSRQ